MAIHLNRKALAIALVVIALVIVLVVSQWHDSPSAPRAEPSTGPSRADAETIRYPVGARQLASIERQVVRRLPLPLSETLSARLVYDEDGTARIGSGVAGRIVRVNVAVGDKVSIGQVLAIIDSPDLGSARSDLDKAHSDEDRKRLAFDRARALGAGEGIATREVETAQADYTEARAETARASRRLTNLAPRGGAITGQQLRLTSPITGVVTERTASIGTEVSAGMDAPLFVITNPRRLWVAIDVPERLLARIRPGSAIDLETDAFPGEHFRGRIERTGVVVDPNSRRATARAAIDNDGTRLLPEMFVRAHVIEPGSDAVRVPTAAIVDSGIGSYVFVESKPGTFSRRKVTLLSRERDFAYVGDGLAGGERIVTKGALLLDAELNTDSGGRP